MQCNSVAKRDGDRFVDSRRSKVAARNFEPCPLFGRTACRSCRRKSRRVLGVGIWLRSRRETGTRPVRPARPFYAAPQAVEPGTRRTPRPCLQEVERHNPSHPLYKPPKPLGPTYQDPHVGPVIPGPSARNEAIENVLNRLAFCAGREFPRTRTPRDTSPNRSVAGRRLLADLETRPCRSRRTW